MLGKGHILAILVIGFSVTTVLSLQAQEDLNIPQWVKNNALWWGQGSISDSDFMSAMSFLIEKKLINVPSADVDKQKEYSQQLQSKIISLQDENQRLKEASQKNYDLYVSEFNSNKKNIDYINYINSEYDKLYNAYLYYYNLNSGYSSSNTANYQQTTPPKSTPPTQETNCDSSYPDFCIPPPPPDLDCGEIQYSNFKVLQPDPHGFDADYDGIGCES